MRSREALRRWCGRRLTQEGNVVIVAPGSAEMHTSFADRFADRTVVA
jgi:hypothetical protein